MPEDPRFTDDSSQAASDEKQLENEDLVQRVPDEFRHSID